MDPVVLLSIQQRSLPMQDNPALLKVPLMLLICQWKCRYPSVQSHMEAMALLKARDPSTSCGTTNADNTPMEG
jgi:hypothetical protein